MPVALVTTMTICGIATNGGAPPSYEQCDGVRQPTSTSHVLDTSWIESPCFGTSRQARLYGPRAPPRLARCMFNLLPMGSSSRQNHRHCLPLLSVQVKAPGRATQPTLENAKDRWAKWMAQSNTQCSVNASTRNEEICATVQFTAASKVGKCSYMPCAFHSQLYDMAGEYGRFSRGL